MKKIYYIIVIILFTFCKEKNSVKENYKRQTVANKYSILIPESLNKTSGLNKYTDFQYENLNDDFYLIIMDESKQGFYNAIEKKIHKVDPNIKGYYTLVKKHFREETNLKDFKVFDEIFELDKIEKKITFSMTGIDMEDNYPVFYRYSIIESKTKYYQIMSWTNQTNAKKLITKMNKSINSFQIQENKSVKRIKAK